MTKRNDKIIDMIALIFKAPSRTVAEVAKLSGVHRSTVSHYMNGLAEEGVLRAEGRSQNRRFYPFPHHPSPASSTSPTESTPKPMLSP